MTIGLNKLLINMGILFCFVVPIALHADFAVPVANWTASNVQQPTTQMNLNWNISLNGSIYTYIYNITGSASSPNNLVLQVNPSYTNLNLTSLITNLTAGVTMSIVQLTATGEPTLTYIDFLNVGNSLTFKTLSAPVWGSFQVFDNGARTGYNANAGTPVTAGTANLTNYVATVGAAVVTPEPSTWLLMGSTLCLAGVMIQRTRKSYI